MPNGFRSAGRSAAAFSMALIRSSKMTLRSVQYEFVLCALLR